MIVPGSANSLLLASIGGYRIERSLRFNSSDSAYLSRTPASAGNRKTWTYSFWIKRTTLGAIQSYLFSGPNGTGDSYVFFNSTDTFAIGTFGSGGWTWLLESSAVFRDSSAWYHFVASIDTTQSTASERAKIYVNGSQITAFSTLTYPTQNFEGQINNNAFQNKIGADAVIRYSSGYLSDIHFVDGQALTPTSFGEFDVNGIWQPKAYSGTYGTNGFRLAFADNSNNTATTLGKDSSPNGNNWTPSNLSVTAGAGNDSLVDSPTNYGGDTGAGGEVRGNYCTWNPLANGGLTLANGNLDASRAATGWRTVLASIGISSGKYYWEFTSSANSQTSPSNNQGVGLAKASASLTTYLGSAADTWNIFQNSGDKWTNNSSSAYTTLWVSGDVIGVAFDADAGTLVYYKNGVSQGNAFTGLTSGPYFPAICMEGTTSGTINFGQRPFAYTAPSGFKALCTQNLPTPVIAKPNTVFDLTLWTGNGTSQTISGLSFSPDLVWHKGRSFSSNQNLVDTARGSDKYVFSNSIVAETTNAAALTGFTADGFTVGADSFSNQNGQTFVGWCWDAGSPATNTQGSITSSVRANASSGFSVVTATVAGSLNSPTIGHGLGVTPGLIIAKSRNESLGWYTWHSSLGANQYLQLNSTAAATTSSNVFGSINSSIITIGGTNTSVAWVSGASGNYVFYCFAPVSSYSAFGSYTGNGNADGPFVYTGFRPRWILVKMSSSTGNWTIIDSAREGYNVDNDPLFPNLSDAEGTTDLIDITSNGFKVRTTDATFNTNAGTYVYAAVAEAPFQFARAR